MTTRTFVLTGLLVALLLAGVAQLLRLQPPRRPGVRRGEDRLPRQRRGPRRGRRPARRLRHQGRRRRAALRWRRRRDRCAGHLVLAGGIGFAVRRRGSRRRAPTDTATSGLRWAPGTATSCTSTATRRSTGQHRTTKILALLGFVLRGGGDAAGLVRRLRRLPARALRRRRGQHGPADLHPQADGRRDPVRGLRRPDAFIATGPRVEVLGLSSARPVCWPAGRCWPRAPSACSPA